jgi:hypothetical protein
VDLFRATRNRGWGVFLLFDERLSKRILLEFGPQ